jgi:hypothetical protein
LGVVVEGRKRKRGGARLGIERMGTDDEEGLPIPGEINVRFAVGWLTSGLAA